jgi:multiple sugar transport system permease protein
MQRTAQLPTSSARRKVNPSLGTLLTYLLCLVVTIVTVAPFVWMVLGSLKTATEAAQYPPSFVPSQSKPTAKLPDTLITNVASGNPVVVRVAMNELSR